MKPNRYVRLANHRWYWTLRSAWQRTAFRVARFIFQRNRGLSEQRKNTSLLMQFARISALDFLFALSVGVALHLSERLLLRLPWHLLPIPVQLSPTSHYAPLLGTIAQIGGVFIGLYYAGVTAAAGAIYAQTPTNIRELLIRETVGNIYMRFLAFVTFLALVLIALNDFTGGPTPRLAMPAITILAGIGIVAFVQLGMRAFHLFDPTQLSHTLFGELVYWANQMAVSGFGWQDRSFQTYAHKRAADAVSALDALTDYCAPLKSLNGTPLINLTLSILNYLAFYTTRKHSIPLGSLWYEQTFSHPEWFTTPDWSVEMAQRTGTTIQPKSVPKHFWLEDRLESIVYRCFEINMTTERVPLLMAVANKVDVYLRLLCAEGQPERAFAIIAGLQKVFLAVPARNDLTSADKIGLADFLAYLPIQVLLGCSQALQERTPKAHNKRLAAIKWTINDSIYRQDFPLDSLETLEWLQTRISSERWTEGATITPQWYCLTLLLLQDARYIAQLVPALLAIDKQYLQFAAELKNSKQPLVAAAVLSRALEYVAKAQRHLASFVALQAEIEANKKISGLDWPKIDPAGWEKALAEQADLVHEHAARLVPLLTITKAESGVPDYRGQFIQMLADDLVASAIAADAVQFAKLFGPYFVGCLAVSDALRPTAPTTALHVLEQQMHVSSAPLIDLMDVSGYAKLLSEYHKKPELWQPVQTTWDVFLEKTPNALQILSSVVSLEQIHFRIPHRAMVRDNWETQVREELHKLPRRIVVVGHFSQVEAFTHHSPLVRLVANSDAIDGVEIFVGDFLARKPGAECLKWGYKRPQEFQDRLERESKRFDGGADEDEAADPE